MKRTTCRTRDELYTYLEAPDCDERAPHAWDGLFTRYEMETWHYAMECVRGRYVRRRCLKCGATLSTLVRYPRADDRLLGYRTEYVVRWTPRTRRYT